MGCVSLSMPPAQDSTAVSLPLCAHSLCTGVPWGGTRMGAGLRCCCCCCCCGCCPTTESLTVLAALQLLLQLCPLGSSSWCPAGCAPDDSRCSAWRRRNVALLSRLLQTIPFKQNGGHSAGRQFNTWCTAKHELPDAAQPATRPHPLFSRGRALPELPRGAGRAESSLVAMSSVPARSSAEGTLLVRRVRPGAAACKAKGSRGCCCMEYLSLEEDDTWQMCAPQTGSDGDG